MTGTATTLPIGSNLMVKFGGGRPLSVPQALTAPLPPPSTTGLSPTSKTNDIDGGHDCSERICTLQVPQVNYNHEVPFSARVGNIHSVATMQTARTHTCTPHSARARSGIVRFSCGMMTMSRCVGQVGSINPRKRERIDKHLSLGLLRRDIKGRLTAEH